MPFITIITEKRILDSECVKKARDLKVDIVCR